MVETGLDSPSRGGAHRTSHGKGQEVKVLKELQRASGGGGAGAEAPR